MSGSAGDEQLAPEGSEDNSLSVSPTQKPVGFFTRLLSFSPKAGLLSFSPLGPNPALKSPQSEDPSQVYYGVYIPCENRIGEEANELHVYTDRVAALKVAKKYKEARFKALRNRREAVVFALRGAEPSSDKTNQSIGDSLLVDANNDAMQPVSQLAGGEKPSQFKGPKCQDMIQFRKLIESGDVEEVRSTVWGNPRYLVSSGDTPSILREGSRYNSLHIAVRSSNALMCDCLLSTISDPHFIQLLYGDENIESSKTRAGVLLDLYLNMPDKAMNETPLHFAVKYGAKEIVDLLVSFPQCSLNVKNKFGDLPKNIICQRAESNNTALISEISHMLRERYYVPVLHSEDITRQPVIGEPFSPAVPPVLNADPISPRLEIRAFAGPMEREEAVSFRRKWKTPPRAGPGERGTLAAAKFRLEDVHKGLEKAGRNLAQKMNIGWREYWPFLDTFTDLTTEEGLGLLEDYLKNKFVAQWNNSSNSVIVSDSFLYSPKVQSKSASLKTGNQNAENLLSPMSDLCNALDSCNLSDNRSNDYKSNAQIKTLPDYKRTQQIAEDESAASLFLNPGLNPYLNVEKSCLVFAKRIALGLTHSLATEPEMVLECLKTETKYLQLTVASFMDDPRFHTVDFHLIHSRVAQLITHTLIAELKYKDDLDALKSPLKKVAHFSNRCLDSYSSDEEEMAFPYRSSPKENKYFADRKQKEINAQVSCIASSILDWVSNTKAQDPIRSYKTEEECIDIWSNLYKCQCAWQMEQFSRNHRKNALMKRNQLKLESKELSTSPKGVDIVSRKLVFDNDNDRGDAVYSRSHPKSDRNHNLPIDNPLSTSPGTNNINSDTSELKRENLVLFLNEDLSDSDNEVFLTPPSSVRTEFLSEESDYGDLPLDLEEKPGVENHPSTVFIYGEEPNKMDKAVFDVIRDSAVDRAKYPYVYSWKHVVGLYTPENMESWPSTQPDESTEDINSPISCSFNIGYISSFGTSTPSKKITNIFTVSKDLNAESTGNTTPKRPNGIVVNPLVMLTPKSSSLSKEDFFKNSATPPMQVSKWMRVTGPNSPRSAFVNKNIRPNVSFGF